MTVTDAQAKAWMEQWRVAGPALEAVWKAELRALTPERARRAVAEIFALVEQWPDKPHRNGSGLVEQQRLFRNLR